MDDKRRDKRKNEDTGPNVTAAKANTAGNSTFSGGQKWDKLHKRI